jgi:hypothetical protein
MHTHISGQTLPFIDQDYPLLENWRQRSPQVLDTVSKMVLDIVEAHGKSDLVPPSYSYIIQAALQHVCTRPNWEDDSTLQNAEERLRISLHYVNTSPRET